MSILTLLDYSLHLAHLIFIGINIFGFIFKKTRKLNLICLILTTISWFILGLWYGIGYCPLTDWHWSIKTSLGETNLPYSYIKYILDLTFQIDSNPVFIDYLTFIVFFISIFLSLYLNYKDGLWKSK